ncbi:pentapeptide repeat-containing protein [Streptomyces sp. WAC07061]|uniref:pentapeptide repeat-containing protein n=1 Tax=Streptomyces sp. WAC07061 TaxID=2487410 RepID=UPI0026829557|nr:pentapeptide repeat-containing protein [Streptomyces sp. WAC07061]
MAGRDYGFLVAAPPDPAALGPVLDAVFGLGAGAVEVGPEGETEGWRWDTPVQCGITWFGPGDLSCQLTVYAAPDVADPPCEEAVARALARGLGTAVLTDHATQPWLHHVHTPGGGSTLAAVEDLDGEDHPALRVTTTQAGVAAFPDAAVRGLPEAVRTLPFAPRGTDPRLWAWADLIGRMEAGGWPPLRWYGADMYAEDLDARDALRGSELEGDPRLEALDARFRAVTVDDAGHELGSDPATAPWYRLRRPAVLPWRVLLPADPEAADWLWKWVEEGAEGKPGGTDMSGLDLSGADLTGADFSSSLFCGTELAGARLTGTDFYRTHLQDADLSGADATGACFVRAGLDGADLRGTVLDGADLVRAELYGADARGASLRGARILGAHLYGTDLRGADLSGAVLRENGFKVTLDDDTRVAGLTGTVFGPAEHVAADGTRTALAGTALEDWIRARGGDVRVIAPRGRP